MNFNTNIEIGARFKLVVRKASDNSISKETEWFNNLVLNSGLNRMSQGVWIDRCCVGTGNIAPIESQTALASFRASTTTVQTTVNSLQTTSAPYYRSSKVTWRFNIGTASGNISEVGLGWGDNSLWNRALIKDINGNPTSLTVLSDEYLDVVSEVREYVASSTTGSFNLLNKSGGIISNHTMIASPYMDIGSNSAVFSIITPYVIRTYSGSKSSSLTTPPSGILSEVTYSSVTYPTTTSMRGVYTLGLTASNGNIKSILNFVSGIISQSTLGSAYQFEINPPITKNNTQILTFTITVSWARYVP